LGCLSGREVCKFHGAEIPAENWKKLKIEVNNVVQNFQVYTEHHSLSSKLSLDRKKQSFSPQNEFLFKFDS
jgi:hypothetical protein